MATGDLMARALAALDEVDGPMPVEVIHRLVDAGAATAPMTITEVADLLDMSPHTLRYYERIGLVEVARDAGGHRSYDARAVRRLVFLTRMRLSGMAMRDLQHYSGWPTRATAPSPSASTCCSNTATRSAASSRS